MGNAQDGIACKEAQVNLEDKHQIIGKVHILLGLTLLLKKHSEQKQYRGGMGLSQNNSVILLSFPFSP